MPLPEEYTLYLKANLTALERFAALFSGLDERLDYTNMLLTKILEAQGGGTTPPPPSGSGFPLNRETFVTGQVTIATADTAQQLTTSSIAIPDGFWLTIVSAPANTGYVKIGNSKGDAEGGQTFNGLDAGLAVALRVKNVNSLWVTSTVAADVVSFIVER